LFYRLVQQAVAVDPAHVRVAGQTRKSSAETAAHAAPELISTCLKEFLDNKFNCYPSPESKGIAKR
jgi:hypothetical protein